MNYKDLEKAKNKSWGPGTIGSAPTRPNGSPSEKEKSEHLETFKRGPHVKNEALEKKKWKPERKRGVSINR